jgi:hypothetical protein
MNRTYKKEARKPSATNLTRHTNHRGLRKRMDRADRRRLNELTKKF